MKFYSLIFKLFLSRLDPELAHKLGMYYIKFRGLIAKSCGMTPKIHADLKTEAMGLTFPSPFGLAAGFDKNGEAIIGLGQLGFGHVEVGTLTAIAQPGNERPRLFRLVQDRALINRMGFNNKGSKVAKKNIAKAYEFAGRPAIGVNIGKSKVTEIENATEDYVLSAERLQSYCDYMVVNVSSPNTPGLRGLQEIDQLEPLLRSVKKAVGDLPLLVKIAPDMQDDQILAIVDLVNRLSLQGIIATNTTVLREDLKEPSQNIEKIGAGGLSGAPLAKRSVDVLKIIRSRADEKLCVISVGGVRDARDVKERLEAGATLVQGYSEFIFQGPGWAKRINKELVKML